MTCNKPFLLTMLVVALVATACSMILADSIAPARGKEDADDLQRLVGGLGCGPAVDLSHCGALQAISAAEDNSNARRP